MRNRQLTTIGLFLAASAAITLSLTAQDAPGWIGKRVVPKAETITLIINGEAIERGGGGVDFYHVEQVDGTSLLLGSDAHRVTGWVERDQVVLVEHGIDFFTQELRTHPESAYYHAARALLWCDKNAFDNALRDYDSAIRLEPKNPAFYCGRGRVWMFRKECDRAIADLGEAINLDPKSAPAFIARGAAWASKREYTKAIDDDSEAIWLDPLAIAAYENRGLAWTAKKEFAKAIVDFTTTLRLDSRRVRSYCDRARAWAALSRFDKALADYDQAIGLDAKSARAHRGRAWLRATCIDQKYRDATQAVASARVACELTAWHDFLALDALAAAHAAAGDFESAVKSQIRANELRHGNEEIAQGDARLKLFQHKIPLRVPPE